MVFRVTPSLPTETVKIDHSICINVRLLHFTLTHSPDGEIGKCEKNKNLKKCFTLDSRGDGVLRVQLVGMTVCDSVT